MEKKMPQKKKQHWIPQGYLRGFTIEGEKSLIWQYDKSKGTAPEFPVSVRKICRRKHYYSQKDQNGRDDRASIENGFQKIESKIARIIRKICAQKRSQRINLNSEDTVELAFFTGLLLTRGPSFRDGINDVFRESAQIISRIEYESGRVPEPPVIVKRLIDEKGFDEVIKVEVLPHVSLGPMIQGAQQIGLALLAKAWTYFKPAQGMTFVTSDNPVHFRLSGSYGPQSIGPAYPLSEVTVPLRKDIVLIYHPKQLLTQGEVNKWHNRIIRATPVKTIEINVRTASSARNFIYSSEKSDELMKMVKLLKGTGQEFRTSGHFGGKAIMSEWIRHNPCC